MATIDIKPGSPSQSVPELFTPEGNSPLPSEGYVVRALPGILGSVDMTAIYVMVIFFITNTPSFAGAGPASFTYLALGALVFFLPCVIATSQLGVMLPHEGSLYNWTHKAFGGYWGFFTAFCAWFPGVLVMIACGDTVVGLISALNSNWLQEPWQQGLAISAIIAVSGFVSTRRFRSVQYIINIVVGLILLVVVMLVVSMLVYLAHGGHPQAVFGASDQWAIHFSGSNQNLNLFGIITLAYLGVEIPMVLGGEINGSGAPSHRARKVITQHLLWGTLLVFACYGLGTLALLVVAGPTNGSVTLAVVNVIGQQLGNPLALLAVVSIMAFFVVDAVLYNIIYSRLLLVGAIDKHLPKGAGKLNRNRVPSNAVVFQTVVAMVITLIIFIVIPLIVDLHESAVLLTSQVYQIMQAAATLVWAISTVFLFVNLQRFMSKDRAAFKKHQIFPTWLLLLANLLGIAGSVAAIIATLRFSWLISSNVDNNLWLLIVGLGTVFLLIIAACGSMIASGEASWEKISSLADSNKKEKM